MDLFHTISSFVAVGFLTNLVGVFIFYMSSVFKMNSLTVHDADKARVFVLSRRRFIHTNVSDFMIHVKVLTILIPFHHFLISLLYMFILFKHDGVFGVYRAFSVTEKWSAFPLVKINPHGIK